MWFLAVVLTLLAPYGGPRVLFRLPAPITESSGLASSSRSDSWLFTHQDSGDKARIYAVSTRGRLLATYRLPGVDARDWEDMARGPDGRGRSSLYLADIGDNRATRKAGVLVHRVAEPTVDPARPGVRAETEPPVSWRLRYPDGPQDAETLLVDPRGGRLYVVTKAVSGTSTVFVAPAKLQTDRPNALTRVGQVVIRPTTTPGGPGIGALASVLVTSGDIAPDRSRVALRTYTDLYEWALGGRDLATALRQRPSVTALPATTQGEGLAYSRDGTAVLLSSEGSDAPVHRLARDTAAAQPSGARGGSPAATPRAATRLPTAHDAAVGVAAAVGATGLVAVGIAVGRALSRRRRRRRAER